MTDRVPDDESVLSDLSEITAPSNAVTHQEGGTRNSDESGGMPSVASSGGNTMSDGRAAGLTTNVEHDGGNTMVLEEYDSDEGTMGASQDSVSTTQEANNLVKSSGEVEMKDVPDNKTEEKEEDLIVAENEDISLGGGWKSYRWVEPNQRQASERGRLSVYGGRDLSLCTSITKLAPLGIGIQMYFKFLQHLAIAFAAMSVIALPLILSCTFGERFIYNPEHLDAAYFVFGTPANLGKGRNVAFNCMHDEMTQNMTKLCQASMRNSTTSMLGGFVDEWSLSNFSALISLLDAGYVCIFVLAVFYFKRSVGITEDSVDRNRTTITDYSIQVSGFPPSTQKKDIVDFFSEKFDPNLPGRIYDSPADRVFCRDIHAPGTDLDDLEVALGKAESRDSVDDDPSQNIESVDSNKLEWWNDPEEEARAKSKNPEYYRKWKARRDQKRKKERAEARMRAVGEKGSIEIPFYPVVNTAMYNEDPRSAELYKGTYVAEVTMAYKDGPTLRRYVAKQHLVRLERRYKALIQMYSHGSEYHDLDETGALLPSVKNARTTGWMSNSDEDDIDDAKSRSPAANDDGSITLQKCAPAACVVENKVFVSAPSLIQTSPTTAKINTYIGAGNVSSTSGGCSKEHAYTSENIINCYCLETMGRWFKQFGKTLGFAGFIIEDGDLCSEIAFTHYGASQLDLVAVLIIVVINVVLTKLIAFLAKWERHPTKTAFLEAQMTKTYFVLLINTAFVVLTVNSDFVKASGGGFSDFSALWYTKVGVSLTLTMCIDVQFTKHVRDSTGRFIRSRELADEYLTLDESREGWIVVFDQERRFAYKSKLWGTGGEAFGVVHDGTTPMFTYEMMLYYQGSSYTYMLRKAMAYAKVLEAQKNAVKARRVKEMRKKIKLAEEAEEKRLKDEEDRKNGIPGRKKSML
eukprot:g744.t1